eukprot:1820591-Alexandrium_andersonii.AAC.1
MWTIDCAWGFNWDCARNQQVHNRERLGIEPGFNREAVHGEERTGTEPGFGMESIGVQWGLHRESASAQ